MLDNFRHKSHEKCSETKKFDLVFQGLFFLLIFFTFREGGLALKIKVKLQWCTRRCEGIQI